MWRTMQQTYRSRLLAHFFPNAQRRCIHEKQSYLFAAVASQTIDTQCRQEPGLFRVDKIWPHAHGRRILNILHFPRLCAITV